MAKPILSLDVSVLVMRFVNANERSVELCGWFEGAPNVFGVGDLVDCLTVNELEQLRERIKGELRKRYGV